MTLTAIVGALVALVARPERREQEEVDRLRRSQRQLIDRVETLERENQGLMRELAAERNLSTHWIAEAARIARQARQDREQWERRERDQPQQEPRQASAFPLQFDGFCNCVPSRGQMFAAVAQLNQLGGRKR